MTGFVAVAGPAGSGIAPDIDTRLAAAIAYCGPDRQDQWHDGAAFLAHAQLATLFEDAGDRQPLTFDGVVWIVADARVDGRPALLRALRDAGRTLDADAPDSAYVLHAWHAWGEACVERLIGDFAFAIWDSARRTLFCARDQFGSVPVHYAEVEGRLIVANAVEAVLAFPGVDDSLNRATVGDFLMFGYSVDPTAGFFAGVKRLAPAHCLTFADGTVRVRCYWTPPAIEPGDPDSSAAALIERFAAIAGDAVEDRLRCSNVGVAMSGGMDSTLVAGFAKQRGGTTTRIEAWSVGSDWLIPDNERYYAGVCADHLGIPFNPVSIEPILFAPSTAESWRTSPEPRVGLRLSHYDLIGARLVETGVRVGLMGMGGDLLAAGGDEHWGSLIARGRLDLLLPLILRHRRYFGKRPPLRSAWLRRPGRFRRHASPAPLALIDPDFATEQRLAERWQVFGEARPDDPRAQMPAAPLWAEMFTACHPESTRLPLRVRQPLFDIRLLELACALPPTPWLFNKTIMRRAAADVLPPAILRRPKTPLAISPVVEAMRRGRTPPLAMPESLAALDGFVNRDLLDAALDGKSAARRLGPGGDIRLQCLSLAVWLERRGGQ